MASKGDRYPVSVKVVSIKGRCSHGLKVGDEWIFDWQTPGGLCLFGLQALLPSIFVLMFGGALPWEPDRDIVTHMACPDGNNPVIFELRRLPKETE